MGQYNIKFNFISDYGILKLCETLEAANHVYVLEIPERISKETLETYKEKLANNKPKKGKKGGKGKKKKKWSFQTIFSLYIILYFYINLIILISSTYRA